MFLPLDAVYGTQQPEEALPPGVVNRINSVKRCESGAIPAPYDFSAFTATNGAAGSACGGVPLQSSNFYAEHFSKKSMALICSRHVKS